MPGVVTPTDIEAAIAGVGGGAEQPAAEAPPDDRVDATGRPFDELLQYFALERFLYRLGRSPSIASTTA